MKRVLLWTITPCLVLLALVLAAAVSFGDDCPAEDRADFPACTASLEVPAVDLGEALPVLYEPHDSGVSKTELIRVSNSATHHYSRRQAWNVDESLLLLTDRILDARSFEVVHSTLKLSSASAWSHTDPKKLYGIRFNPKPNELAVWDVVADTIEVLDRFDDYEECRFGDGEGQPSNDDSLVVISCEDADDQKTLISYQLNEKRILGELKASPDFNWASVSPLGNYVIVENSRIGVERRELYRYSTSLEQPLLLTTAVEHGDLGVDVDGEEVFVMIDWDDFHYYRLRDGRHFRIPLSATGDAVGYGHMSCRAYLRPGWCYVSTYGEGLIGAIRIGLDRDGIRRSRSVAEAGRVGLAAFELWGYHQSSGADYAAEAKASVSPSGRQVIFTSDWHGKSVPSAYILRLRSDSDLKLNQRVADKIDD